MINSDSKHSYKKNGFLHIKNFYDKNFIESLKEKTVIFLNNFKSDSSEIGHSDFETIDKNLSKFSTRCGIRKLFPLVVLK